MVLASVFEAGVVLNAPADVRNWLMRGLSMRVIPPDAGDGPFHGGGMVPLGDAPMGAAATKGRGMSAWRDRDENASHGEAIFEADCRLCEEIMDAHEEALIMETEMP